MTDIRHAGEPMVVIRDSRLARWIGAADRLPPDHIARLVQGLGAFLADRQAAADLESA